jgi:hypothetical protein
MVASTQRQLIRKGMMVAESKMFQEDKIWSRYSNDKVDIGETLARVTRTLYRTFPLDAPLSALSIGSSNEPQFRLLETAFRSGLYLLDIEQEALQVVRERILRQRTDHVYTTAGDFREILFDSHSSRQFVCSALGGSRMQLVTLHHSLYYCEADRWLPLFKNLLCHVLSERGAIHAVLMAPDSSEVGTTGWLYEHFASRYFGHHNEQDLQALGREVQTLGEAVDCQVLMKQSRIHFSADDFEKFMAVVWMILLYPGVHRFSEEQRREITAFMLDEFWTKQRPLWQLQDHVVIYRGIPFAGLI